MRTKSTHTRLAILVLLLLSITLFSGFVMRFTQSLFQPLSLQIDKSYSWDGNSQINLVLKTSTVSLLSFDPSESVIRIVEIPEDTYMNIPGGYGPWPLRSIYSLGEGESPPQGVKFLKESFSIFFGLPIDGFLSAEAESGLGWVNSFRHNPIKLNYFTNLKTDLTPLELVRLIFAIQRVRFDKITSFDLQDRGLLASDVLSDGTPIVKAELSKIDSFVVDRLSDSKLRQEQMTIAVFNGTKNPGLAQKAARIISNLGGNVIIETNFVESGVKYSFVFPEDKSYTQKRLKQIFALNCRNINSCAKLDQESLSRAQINVVLGEDFSR